MSWVTFNTISGTHLGSEKTAEGITEKYHWNGIYKFIKDFIRQCAVCVERHPQMLAPSDQFVSQNLNDGSDGEEKETEVLPADSNVLTLVS